MKTIRMVFILVLLLSCTRCKGQGEKKVETIQNKSDMLIDNLTKEERDPQMMFYLEQAYGGKNVKEILTNTESEMLSFFETIPEEKMHYRYGSGKWTLAEVLQHIISYEKIMLESALKIASKKVDNPMGYYNQSTTAAVDSKRTKAAMIARFKKVRARTINTIAQFSEQELEVMGIHEWFAASPRTLVLCISGHQAHHFDVIKNSYLN